MVPSALTRPQLGIAFGGGGMKGWAHLGVISVLERYGLRPDIISGCSAGTLIGAFYAAGHSVEKMIGFMREQRTASLFSLRFDGLGLLSSDNLRAYLSELLGECRFEDLPVPFFAVATDLESGKEVILSEGPLLDAVLASIAIPGIFSPVEIKGRLLVDGGLTNNVPVSVLVNRGARFTVGVRLHKDTHELSPRTLVKAPPDPSERRVSLAMWTERLARTIRRDQSHLPSGFEVLGRAMDIVLSQLEAYRLQAYRPDVLITPEVAHVGTFSFSEEKEALFDRGVQAAEAQAPLLEALAERLRHGAD